MTQYNNPFSIPQSNLPFSITQSLLDTNLELSDNPIVTFSIIAGCVLISDQQKLSNAIRVVTRGNCYIIFRPINDSILDEKTVIKKLN